MCGNFTKHKYVYMYIPNGCNVLGFWFGAPWNVIPRVRWTGNACGRTILCLGLGLGLGVTDRLFDCRIE